MLKRIVDIFLSSISLVIFSPLLLFLALLISSFLGKPIFFCQARPGLHGKPFNMVKFRTMSEMCDPNGALLSDADRLGRFGKFLRSTSLDELPELWNVLKGDMSLVGPRPLLMEYLPLYTIEQARRQQVVSFGFKDSFFYSERSYLQRGNQSDRKRYYGKI